MPRLWADCKMGRITAYFLRMFRAWERSTQIAFLLSLGLLIVAFMVFQFGPQSLHQPALIGMVGLLFAAQIIFMWANRTMVTPFTEAQRYYRAEDFERARMILEQVVAAGKADVNVLTLLANTHRQLGDLDQSEEIVKKALLLRPKDHFPLYAFGRTLLIKGEYLRAAAVFQEAHNQGAPDIVLLDLGEAWFRAERPTEALQPVEQEPHRLLMMQYLRYRLGAGQPPESQIIADHVNYWQETAQRFQHTPYGIALAYDVSQMKTLSEAT
jgi:tetratricopeptide (TPR) repeat protein